MNWDLLPFAKDDLEVYLSQLYQNPVTVTGVEKLADQEDGEEIKGFGYGRPLLITLQQNEQEDRIVFHTMAGDAFGHERPSDRARNMLLDYETFNRLPRHVTALDVGALGQTAPISLGQAGEFFLLTRYVSGKPYANDLKRILAEDKLQPGDTARAEALAAYLARIHQQKQPDPVAYRRCIRDLLGHGEGIMGILDGYPADFEPAPPARLQAIEEKCVAWRWRIKERPQRLSQVHGDFHPWNVLFRAGADFSVLDRSRGAWGEPADDVTSLSINYLFFWLQQSGGANSRFQGPFRQLFDLFWQHYGQASGDEDMGELAPPFLAWRALVLAHPRWYPNLETAVRQALFRFVENVLAADRFDPAKIENYLH